MKDQGKFPLEWHLKVADVAVQYLHVHNLSDRVLMALQIEIE